MGAWAVDRLVGTIENPEVRAEQVRLPCPLVVRDSVAAPPIVMRT
jgi:DNA-binding LacI/PurR family transcriptional regulator